MAIEIWVCAGERRGTKDGKPVSCFEWWQLDAGGKKIAAGAKGMLFPKMKGAWLGVVREVNVTRGEAGSITMGLGKMIETFDNAKLLAEWKGLAASAQAEVRARSDERKSKNAGGDAFREALEPIRRAYWRSEDPIGREVILARVIRFITQWKD